MNMATIKEAMALNLALLHPMPMATPSVARHPKEIHMHPRQVAARLEGAHP